MAFRDHNAGSLPAQRIIRGGSAIHLSVITFVLIHGSRHDGSAWRDVIWLLESHGHKAFGPTVAGHGKRVCKQASHAQSTQSIVDFIVSHDLTDIVLVGHSYGGTIISKVVEAIPDQIRRLVFCSGSCPTMVKASTRRCRRTSASISAACSGIAGQHRDAALHDLARRVPQ
jgi:pimeloyl-ACP methyl ester carboxylesterase